MHRTRNLEQTPGLIDADVADEVRSVHASVSVLDPAGCTERQVQVGDNGAVEDDRIIETDGGRHAIAELVGVLDVVHAGDVGMTAEQVGRVVARITVPRRRNRPKPTCRK